MKIDLEKINRLRKETGMEYGLCEKALIKTKNDYDKALIYINNYNSRLLVRINKHLTAITVGNKSYRFTIRNNGETVFDISVFIPIILSAVLIFLPKLVILVPLWLLITVILNFSVSIEAVSINEPEEYAAGEDPEVDNTTQNSLSPVTPPLPEVTQDEEGFNIIEIS